jgi:Bacterial membrane protein YfhO
MALKEPIGKSWVSYLADGAILAGLCLLFFWRDLTPVMADRWSFAAGDFTQQFYAFARYEAARLQSGQLPLWNPYIYAGHPFLADIQSAVFYPLSLLTMLLTAAKGFTYRALEMEAIGHFFLAALFTYLLARRLTRSRSGGLAAAIAFAFSGYLTSYPPLQLAILETQVWLPLLLLLLDVAAERLERGVPWAASRWAVAAGLAFGVALLSGHPQSGLLVGYAGLAFGLFRFWPRPLARRLSAWRWPLALLALFGLFGLGIAAIQLVPSWELVRLSTRSTLPFEEAGSGFTPYDLLQPILPALGGNVPALYLGVLPVGLAILALTAVRRDPGEPLTSRRLIVFFGWAIVVSLLLSFGKHVAAYSMAYLLAPGWKMFRGQERTVVWAVLAVALLSGYGIAWLGRRWATLRSLDLLPPAWPAAGQHQAGQAEPDGDPSLSVADKPRHSWTQGPDGVLAFSYAAGAAGALLLALVFFVGYQSGHDNLWGFTAAAMTLAMFLLLSALAVRSRQPALLLAVMVLDLFTYHPRLHAGPPDQVDLTPYHSLLSVPLGDTSIFRIANEDVLPENSGLLLNLEDISGGSPMELGSYERWLRAVPVERAWRLLNVKYVVSWRQSLEAPAETLAQATGRDGKPVYLYRLNEVGPRAWLVGEAITEPDLERTLQRLDGADFDSSRQVLLPAVPLGFGETAQCNGQVAYHQRAPEEMILDVSTDWPCLLVLADLYYPGWQATVDGQPAPILRADGVLRAVAVTPGSHQINLVYRPASLRWGALISLLTLVAAIVWLAVSWVVENKRRTTPAPPQVGVDGGQEARVHGP